MGCGASATPELQRQLDKQNAEIESLRALAVEIAAKDKEVAFLQSRIKQYEVSHNTVLKDIAPPPESVRPNMCVPSSTDEIKQPDLRRAITSESVEVKTSRSKLLECLHYRKKWMPERETKTTTLAQTVGSLSMILIDGVADIPGLDLPPVPSREEFRHDLVALWKIVKTPEVKTLAMARLERLSARFQSYALSYSAMEREDSMSIPGDIFSVNKVDNHIHLAASMPPTMLLNFIQHKIKTEPNIEAAPGKSLKAIICEALNCSDRISDPEAVAEKIYVDSLRTCAGDHFYHRFDVFNDAYSPLGSKLLRSVFLKTSNHMQGRYFAELTHEVIHSFEKNNSFAEMRLSIYGRSANEWDDLARWVRNYNLHKEPSTKRNLWMVQIPRIFKVHVQKGTIENFEDMLSNIFQALYEVALDPSSHPELAEVMPSIVGVDCVDDESIADPLIARRSQIYGDSVTTENVNDALKPSKWTAEENPPYSYYCYFLYANIRRFNDLCATLGRPWHLSFRPHAGEAGEVHHLATAFLLADGINHGINLWHSPVLQYLYYLSQLGISVAPISNNALFLKIKDNPFPFFFRRGLNVSLSTDDPLMFHSTKQPLLEEYTVARLVFGLTNVDLCEIAANSVRQSGFSAEFQAAALGEAYSRPYQWTPSACNIPVERLRYRRGNLAEELAYLRIGAVPLAEVCEPETEPYWRSFLDGL